MRNTFSRTVSVAAASLLPSWSAALNAQSPVTSRCESAAIFAQYVAFSDTGRMQALQPRTRFAMSSEGWREAADTAAKSAGTPGAWTMIERDVVLADGETVSGGDIALQSFDMVERQKKS